MSDAGSPTKAEGKEPRKSAKSRRQMQHPNPPAENTTNGSSELDAIPRSSDEVDHEGGVSAPTLEHIKADLDQLKRKSSSSTPSLDEIRQIWDRVPDGSITSESASDIIDGCRYLVAMVRRVEGDTSRVREFIRAIENVLRRLPKATKDKLSDRNKDASSDPEEAFTAMRAFKEKGTQVPVKQLLEPRLNDDPSLAVPWVVVMLKAVTPRSAGENGTVSKMIEKPPEGVVEQLEELANRDEWNAVLPKIAEQLHEYWTNLPALWKERLKPFPRHSELPGRPASPKLAHGVGAANPEPVPAPLTRHSSSTEGMFTDEAIDRLSTRVADSLLGRLSDRVGTSQIDWSCIMQLLASVSRARSDAHASGDRETVCSLEADLALADIVPTLGGSLLRLAREVRALKKECQDLKLALSQRDETIETLREDKKIAERRVLSIQRQKEEVDRENYQLNGSINLCQKKLKEYEGRREKSDVLREVVLSIQRPMQDLIVSSAKWTSAAEGSDASLEVTARTVRDLCDGMADSGIECFGVPGKEVVFDKSRHTIAKEDGGKQALTREDETVVVRLPGFLIRIDEKVEVLTKAEVELTRQGEGECSAIV